MIDWEVPPTRRVAFVAVLAVMAASLLVTIVVSYRLGGYLLAASLVLAGALRAFLPPQYCLGLLVRSRRIDVATTLLLAAAITFFAATVPGASV